MRHKTNDHVWFSFFHEAGHILLHSKKKVFIDEIKGGGNDVEDEANGFASDMLIPPAQMKAFVQKANFSAPSISAFAKRIGTAPGVVVGRLQHDRLIPFSAHNSLKERLTWSD